jgi:hypothetical protein
MAAVISSISVDCALSRVTINGTGLSVTPTWAVEVDGTAVAYTLISATPTASVIEITPFPDGEYCIAPLDTNLQTSNLSDIQTSNSIDVYTVVDAGFFCATFTCSIQTSDPVTLQWKLYRFDLKIRGEDTP